MCAFKKQISFSFSILMFFYSTFVFAVVFDSKVSSWQTTNEGDTKVTFQIPAPLGTEEVGGFVFRIFITNSSQGITESVPRYVHVGEYIELNPGDNIRIMVVSGDTSKFEGVELIDAAASAEQKMSVSDEPLGQVKTSGQKTTYSKSKKKTREKEIKKEPTVMLESEIFNIIEKLDDKKELTDIIRSILKDDELLQFARKLYDLLTQVNPYRLTYGRRKEEQMLDAFARLLVGDETCAAVAFDGEHLLIATNEDVHKNYKAVYSVYHTRKPGIEGNFISCVPEVSISFNDRPPIQVFAQDFSFNLFLKPNVDQEGRLLQHLVLRPTVDKAVFIIPASLHKIPDHLLDITIRIFYKEIIMPEVTSIIIGARLPTQFQNNRIYLDPLRERVKVILDYFLFIIQANNPVFGEEYKREALQILESHRDQLLMQSLAWEAAKWYRYDYAKDLRDYSDSEKKKFKPQIDKFISQLHEDFVHYKKDKNITKTTSIVVKQWWDEVITKIKAGSFSKPEFIKPDGQFIKFAFQYFIDLENLGAYFVESFKKGEKLALLLAQESRFEEKNLPFIVDGGGQKLHAEMRILLHLLREHRPIPYIATSKLTCCHCNLIAQLFGRVNGRHGKICIWKAEALIKELTANGDAYLKQVFPKELYGIYDRMKSEPITIYLPGDKQCITNKAIAALLVFQLIGCLENISGSNGYLEMLGYPYKKLYYRESDYPDEINEDECHKDGLVELQESSFPPLSVEQKEDIKRFLTNISWVYINAIRNAGPGGEVLWGGDIELVEIACLRNLRITVYEPSNTGGARQNPPIGPENGIPINLWLAGGHYQNYNPEIGKLTNVPGDGNCLFHAVLRAEYDLDPDHCNTTYIFPLAKVVELRVQVADILGCLVADLNQHNRHDANPIYARFAAIFEAENREQLSTAIAYLPPGSLREQAVRLLPQDRRNGTEQVQPSFNATLAYATKDLKETAEKFVGILTQIFLHPSDFSASGVSQ